MPDYAQYVREAVERGRREIAAGAGLPHAQVAAELRAKYVARRSSEVHRRARVVST